MKKTKEVEIILEIIQNQRKEYYINREDSEHKDWYALFDMALLNILELIEKELEVNNVS